MARGLLMTNLSHKSIFEVVLSPFIAFITLYIDLEKQ